MSGAPSPAGAKRKFDFGEITALLGHVRPWRGRFAMAMAALMVSMSFGLMFPLLIGRLIDAALPTAAALHLSGWRRKRGIRWRCSSAARWSSRRG